jgi:hypothetical protein
VENDTDPDIPDGPAKELGASEIDILIKKLPLRVEVVNFENVDRFLLLYAPFSANKKQVRIARRSFRNARSLLRAEATIFSLLSGESDIMSMLAPPKPNEGVPYTVFLTQMQNGLLAVEGVLLEFQARTEDKLSPNQAARINGQVHGSKSVAQSNINTIATLMSRAEPKRKFPY